MHTLHNDFLELGVSNLGAEWQHIVDKQTGQELLWQGDAAVWGRRAPVLFPIVGKAFNNELNIEGENYPMGQHGFARDKEFELTKAMPDELTFTIQEDEESVEVFPFPFELSIGYRLKGRSIETIYTVRNTGMTDLPFSIGAHPGFLLPSQNLADYYIEFEQEEPLIRYLLDGGLFDGRTEKLSTEKNRLYLSAELLAKDALVFKNLHSSYLIVKQKDSSFAIKVTLKGFPYLGIWTKPGQEAFLCIEPWCGLADKVGGQASITEKEGMNMLAPNELFERTFSTTFSH